MSALFLDVRTLRAQIGALRHNYPELNDDAQLLEDSLAGETDFLEVMTKLVRFERDAASFAIAIKSQEEELATRRARYVQRQAIYRAMMHALMDSAGQTRLPLPEATISVARGRPGCVITDETVIPDEFVKVERTPKKLEIIAALLEGRQVSGAELKNPMPHIVIRT